MPAYFIQESTQQRDAVKYPKEGKYLGVIYAPCKKGESTHIVNAIFG
jgi:hypothetical protein